MLRQSHLFSKVLGAATVMLVAAGCQAPAEEFSVPDWTPVVAVPLVDTRFDLEDVMGVLSDGLDTVPIEANDLGQLACLYT